MSRSRLRSQLAAAVAVLALALAVPASAQACRGSDALPGRASERTLVRATLCLLNQRRAGQGMRRLRLDPRLSRAARGHALDMVRKRYFAHDSLAGDSFVDRIRASGYLSWTRGWLLGENLAWGSGALGTPRAIVRAWMRSPGHRRNILTRGFRDIGVGVVSGAPVPGVPTPAGTYATDFGALI